MDEWKELQESMVISWEQFYEWFCELCKPFLDICKQVSEYSGSSGKSSDKIVKQKNYIVNKCKKIKPLLLDKRSKIHRCRNTC